MKFQRKVNQLTGNKHLVFLMEVWNGKIEDGVKIPNISVRKSLKFPYLDMELQWKGGDLHFNVHLKPNQKLKYLNKGSSHQPAIFDVIVTGVCKRLA